MKKTKQFLVSSLLAMGAMGVVSPVLVNAESSTEVKSTTKITKPVENSVMKDSGKSKTFVNKNGVNEYNPNSELPSVNAKDAMDWSDRKGNDAYSVAGEFGKKFLEVCFLISFILMGVGAIGRNDWFQKGLLGLGISGLAWTGVVFAKDLLNFFSTWLAS